MDLRLLNTMPLPDGAVWIELDPIDLDLLQWDADDAARQRVLDNSMAGPAASLWIHGRPLCCVGVADRRGGLGEAWAVIDKERRHTHPLLLTRGISRALDITVQSLGLSEVHLFVQFSKVPAMRWAKALGFELKGELVMYDHPTQNHFIFARRY